MGLRDQRGPASPEIIWQPQAMCSLYYALVRSPAVTMIIGIFQDLLKLLPDFLNNIHLREKVRDRRQIVHWDTRSHIHFTAASDSINQHSQYKFIHTNTEKKVELIRSATNLVHPSIDNCEVRVWKFGEPKPTFDMPEASLPQREWGQNKTPRSCHILPFRSIPTQS